ncbi:hypothetical protein WR25_08141 isoform A [Diploscapter pachys]|uniref:Uncharacterized protein n=2 Tax=Diploscapter pachys TaxID=2018661 RepID=A0A2A2KPJ0_9BILA|nr:hypothetical protein WR25_08141 isoform A [Diploscapter pachys]
MPGIFSWSSDSDSDSRDCDAGIGKRRSKLNGEDKNRQNADRTDDFATRVEQEDRPSEKTLSSIESKENVIQTNQEENTPKRTISPFDLEVEEMLAMRSSLRNNVLKTLDRNSDAKPDDFYNIPKSTVVPKLDSEILRSFSPSGSRFFADKSPHRSLTIKQVMQPSTSSPKPSTPRSVTLMKERHKRILELEETTPKSGKSSGQKKSRRRLKEDGESSDEDESGDEYHPPMQDMLEQTTSTGENGNETENLTPRRSARKVVTYSEDDHLPLLMTLDDKTAERVLKRTNERDTVDDDDDIPLAQLIKRKDKSGKKESKKRKREQTPAKAKGTPGSSKKKRRINSPDCDYRPKLFPVATRLSPFKTRSSAPIRALNATVPIKLVKVDSNLEDEDDDIPLSVLSKKLKLKGE